MIRRQWTTGELTRLKEFYPNMPMVQLSGMLGRTVSSIQGKAQELGLRREIKVLWSKRELAQLKRLYSDTPMLRLSELLGRTKSSIHGKAKELGLRRSAEFWASEHSGRVRAGQSRGVATRFQKGVSRNGRISGVIGLESQDPHTLQL